ncbi:hypothetical protein HMPREF9103_02065 [Lentilactobacillus parafarraginis F0439]|uniref:Uncharacterized protein n=1 Tax=Lentilactobacillus parafarraginis F0439 TaxID=797515 RepID=G9ZQQ7_9LACO|nr:hypothetical protein HMPREF9103_02065 [Lentilactobacillus parafarraginis F0439]
MLIKSPLDPLLLTMLIGTYIQKLTVCFKFQKNLQNHYTTIIPG